MRGDGYAAHMAADLARSMQYYLGGEVYVSIGPINTVVVWVRPMVWQKSCQTVFPTWMFECEMLPFLEDWVMSVLKKVSAADLKKMAPQTVQDDELERQYPALKEYMTVVQYPDGSKRELATLLLFVMDGQWKAMLRDKDNGRCMWATGKTYAEALEVLDQLLGEPNGPWRADRSPDQPQASRLANGKGRQQGKK